MKEKNRRAMFAKMHKKRGQIRPDIYLKRDAIIFNKLKQGIRLNKDEKEYIFAARKK